MGSNNPSLRAQWLGRQLRELREQAGIKMVEAGHYLKRDSSTMSRFETGVYPIHEPGVQQLLDLYGVRDEAGRSALLRLSAETWRTGWWDGYANDVEGSFIDYVWQESRATEIRTFDAATFHGLFQTPDYARQVIRGVDGDVGAEQVDRWIELRMMRQAILERSVPPTLSMILDEALLHRHVGGPEVQARQLRRLGELVERPNIEIRVLPFSAGAHASPDGAFKIITLPEPFPQVACVESPAGAIYLEPPHIERFTAVYDRFQEAALTPTASLTLIKKVSQNLE